MLFGAAGAAEVVAVAAAAGFGVAAVAAAVEGAVVAARAGDGAAGAKFRNWRMNNKTDEWREQRFSATALPCQKLTRLRRPARIEGRGRGLL
ncbi:hypothetical protein AXW67_07175 [Bradyrhizobium neotropicale]|uniref:Uncharacterized protein n=1 Tax=Bradyrhizobium neotropicale TaxID=1497615 RepID=A0A176ZBB4_9BRAD|nr:hypothetical protein AXW67_07175 [Bradyrhizobium neotropicale]